MTADKTVTSVESRRLLSQRSPRAAAIAATRPHDTGADQIPRAQGADGAEPASTGPSLENRARAVPPSRSRALRGRAAARCDRDGQEILRRVSGVSVRARGGRFSS